MDTPEKKYAGDDPFSGYKDSPVFSFIKSLSPIKPMKSIHVTPTVTALSFGCLPAVFTSPRVCLKHEQRLPRGHSELDSYPQLEASFENNETRHRNEATAVSVACMDECTSLKLQCDESGYRFDTLGIMRRVDGSPNGQSSLGTTAPLAPTAPTVKGDQAQFEYQCVKHGIELKKELVRREWGNSMLDGSDLFAFNSPDGAEAVKGLAQRSLDINPASLNSPITRFLQNEANDVGKACLVAQINSDQQHTRLASSCSTEHMDKVITTRDHLATRYPEDYFGVSLDQDFLHYKPIHGFSRGLRRCLEFEMAEGTKRFTEETAPNILPLAAARHPEDQSSLRGIVPGIGLHLNAVATYPYKHKHEHLSGETQNTDMRTSSASLKFPWCARVAPQGPLTSGVSKMAEEQFLSMEDDLPADVDCASEGLTQGSLDRKRHKGENSGERGACKRCNCKKSKCLKLYCECFAAGLFCTDPCACQECLNKPIHRKIILETRKQIESRNPIAFAPKVIGGPDDLKDNEDALSKTPTSARHKKGCNCKKSGCSKKYCECYQSGVGCSFNCRCEGCKNSFGRKDADPIADSTAQAAEEDNEKHEKKKAHSTCRTALSSLLSPFPKAALTLMTKRPRSSSLVMPTAVDQTSRLLGKSYFPGSGSKAENHSYATPSADEMPTILRNGTIKTSSPKSKRVSPPNKGGFGSSAEARGGRRLMLKSIPSFPSL